jgi:hypothetical protein
MFCKQGLKCKIFNKTMDVALGEVPLNEFLKFASVAFRREIKWQI